MTPEHPVSLNRKFNITTGNKNHQHENAEKDLQEIQHFSLAHSSSHLNAQFGPLQDFHKLLNSRAKVVAPSKDLGC